MRDQVVRRTRFLFIWLAWIFAACILVQVFLAGLALFYDSAYWASHKIFVRCFSFLPILMLILSFIARLPSSLRLQSAGLFCMIILMAVSANLSSGVKFLSALHPVLALLMFWNTMIVARQTGVLIKEK